MMRSTMFMQSQSRMRWQLGSRRMQTTWRFRRLGLAGPTPALRPEISFRLTRRFRCRHLHHLLSVQRCPESLRPQQSQHRWRLIYRPLQLRLPSMSPSCFFNKQLAAIKSHLSWLRKKDRSGCRCPRTTAARCRPESCSAGC